MTGQSDPWDEMEMALGPLGRVAGGSLGQGLDVRLQPGASAEEVKAGTFVTVQGQRHRFFGMVTDLSLQSADPRFAATMADVDDTTASVISVTSAFAMAKVTPMLALSGTDESLQPARSLPGHFSPVHRASNDDVQAVFGTEDARHIYVGSPLDMEDTRVCLNLEELVKRSNGVFGKTGSGKSVLTRILLAGILQKGVATNLVFDMHSEYGWGGTGEGGYELKGLKQIYGSRVAVFALDEPAPGANRRSSDYVVRIGYDEVEPEDVAILAPTLNITELGVQASYNLARHFGEGWVRRFLALSSDGLGALAVKMGESSSTLEALRRRLAQLHRFDFLTERQATGKGAVDTLLDYLARGIHVVLEFGRYGDDLVAYLLVANLLTRRIYQRYRQLTEEAQANRNGKPSPLVITIEEAHRFLSPQVAGQTIFGTIAREMRKYAVTLLVVDQRPSGIDNEVLSQVGTRLICQLDDDRDVDAVLTGAPGARELKTVLSRLESQRQALIFGHALPMPVVVRTREYGQQLYAEHTAGSEDGLSLQAQRQRDKKDLFG
jgi:DNA helicase HerA-like ATPase